MRLDKFSIARLSALDKVIGITVIPVLVINSYRLATGASRAFGSSWLDWALLVAALSQYLYFVGGYSYLVLRRKFHRDA